MFSGGVGFGFHTGSINGLDLRYIAPASKGNRWQVRRPRLHTGFAEKKLRSGMKCLNLVYRFAHKERGNVRANIRHVINMLFHSDKRRIYECSCANLCPHLVRPELAARDIGA
jgi:hypothetical protein